MIAYTPLRKPFLGQAAAPSDQLLTQLLGLQGEIKTILAAIPPGSVDQARIDGIKKKLDQCIAFGPTAEGLKCFMDLRVEVQSLATAPKPLWPWIIGGAAVVGVAAFLLSQK